MTTDNIIPIGPKLTDKRNSKTADNNVKRLLDWAQELANSDEAYGRKILLLAAASLTDNRRFFLHEANGAWLAIHDEDENNDNR